METSVTRLMPHLQLAIGPVIFISGVGLLLLTMTNRFGRVIDRTRALASRLRRSSEPDRAYGILQIDILYRRIRNLRRSITFTAGSVFFVSVLMIVLFLAALLGLDWAVPVTGLFAGALACLTVGVALFIYDFHLSLSALDFELEAEKKAARVGEDGPTPPGR